MFTAVYVFRLATHSTPLRAQMAGRLDVVGLRCPKTVPRARQNCVIHVNVVGAKGQNIPNESANLLTSEARRNRPDRVCKTSIPVQIRAAPPILFQGSPADVNPDVNSHVVSANRTAVRPLLGRQIPIGPRVDVFPLSSRLGDQLVEAVFFWPLRADHVARRDDVFRVQPDLTGLGVDPVKLVLTVLGYLKQLECSNFGPRGLWGLRPSGR
jgi:hypothetical protein